MKLAKVYLFLIILATGTVYAALWSNFIFAISAIVLIAILLKEVGIGYKRSNMITYATMSMLLGIILIIHYAIVPLANNPIPYLTFYLRFIIIGMFFIYLADRKIDFALLLKNVLQLFAWHSVVAFVFSFFLAGYVFKVNSEKFYSDTFYYIFFYNSTFNLFGITFYRNQGLFWEPGILQIFMNILFFISSFIYPNKKNQILSAFSILSTYSTTGIAILILQFLVILFTGKITKVQKAIIFLILFAVTLPLFFLNYANKTNESSSLESDVSSSALRAYDFVEGINITMRFPLTGIGLSEDTYTAVKNVDSPFLGAYSQAFVDSILSRKSANSVFLFFSRFGIPFALLWFILLYKQDLFREKRWVFFLIITIANLSEPLLMEPFFILVSASGLYSLMKFKISALN